MKMASNCFTFKSVVNSGKTKVLACGLCCLEILLVFVGSGCGWSVSSEQINQGMAFWQDCHYSKVIEVWGPPFQIIDDDKGGKIISWEQQEVITIPGSSTTHYYGFTGTAYTTHRPDTVRVHRFTATFWTDSKGIIYNWSWRRNGQSGSKERSVGCKTLTKQLSAGKIILPPDIAGIWKAQDSPWKIVLSGDGTVSSAVIPMGEVEIKPNQTTKVEMKDGSLSTFKAGDCVVEYTPKMRELFVSVEMEQIHIKFLDNVIDGNSLDRFVGPVSQDGKFWMADWITIFDYGPRFSQEPNDIFAKPLVFQRIE